MTEVTFHFNTQEKLGHALRVVRQVSGKGNRLVVTGEPALLRELDVLLWTFEPLEFLPHGYAGAAPEAVVAASPVVLADSTRAAPHHEVLLNLGDTVPEGFERFERLVEVVTVDPEDRVRGRQRTKHYRDRGYAVRHYDTATGKMLS
jgi:DNA polymerase-3 subunit chi